MKQLGTWLKNLRPLKVLTVFLVGIFLFVTQACASPGVATQPPQPDAQTSQSNDYTKRYDPTKDYPLSSPSGGINNFSDVDPRAKDEKAVNDKADALVRNAQKNIDEKGVRNPAEAFQNLQKTPVGDKLKDAGENIGSSVQEVGEGLAKGIQQGIENIKGNSQNAAEDVTKNVQRGAEDAGDAVKRTVRNID